MNNKFQRYSTINATKWSTRKKGNTTLKRPWINIICVCYITNNHYGSKSPLD